MRKELNFGNEITEIPSVRIHPKGKNQLWQPSCQNSWGVRREKKGLWQLSCRNCKGEK